MRKYKRKMCPPIKDKRPKGMRSVPAIGYALMQVYEWQLGIVDNPIITEAVKELREKEEQK